MSSLAAVVLVPVKPLAVAKSRLRAGLGPATDSLVLAMAMDTIAAAAGSRSVRSVAVITDDPDVGAAARSLGAAVVADRAAAGLNAALREVAGQVPAGCITVAQPADCPCLRTADLDSLIAVCGRQGGRVFVPDADGTGTTTLAAPAGAPLRPRYGANSRAAHIGDGARELLGAPWAAMRRDVDTWNDLTDANVLGVGVHTQHWLREHC